VVNAGKDLAKEARKQARRKSKTAPPPDRRQRAQRFLRDALADGPKCVSDLEEHQARADLGIVTSRANTGGAHAVQWSLPG
jgi:hypothetical protein